MSVLLKEHHQCNTYIVVFPVYIPARPPTFHFSYFLAFMGLQCQFNQSQPVDTVHANGSPQG